jgi:hypothetical protein
MLRAGRLHHQGLVQRRQRQKIEVVESFDRRELVLLDPPLDQLQFGQTQQIADMIDCIGRTLPGQLARCCPPANALAFLDLAVEDPGPRIDADRQDAPKESGVPDELPLGEVGQEQLVLLSRGASRELDAPRAPKTAGLYSI